MKSRTVLLVSLALNLVCVVGLLWRGRPPETEPTPVPQAIPAAVGMEPLPEPVPSRFHWSQIESTNYFEYIANLREIGCPEPTIRDIISADLIAVLRHSPSAGPSGRTDAAVSRADLQVTPLLRPQSEPFPERPAPGDLHAPAIATFAATPDIRNTDVASAGLLVRHLLNPQTEPLPAPSVQGGPDLPPTEPASPAPDSASGDEPTAAMLESRRMKRFEALQRTWMVDMVRARYGIEALLGWQQQAVREGISFEEFVQHHQIPIPTLPSLALQP